MNTLPRRLRPVAPGLFRHLMKPFVTCRSALLAAFLSPLGATAFTYVTPDELHLWADLDGDTRADAIIVDRVTGSFRAGYQTVAGEYKWAAARASGVQQVTGASGGKILDLAKQQLLVTAVEANAVHILNAENLTTNPPPVATYPTLIGPSEVVAVDIASAGNTPHDDLVIVSTETSPAIPAGVERRRNNAGTFSGLGSQAQPALLEQLQVVRLAAAGPDLVGGILRDPVKDTFRIWAPTSFPSGFVTEVTVPPSQTHLFGRFNAHDRHHFLFFQPGKSDFLSVPVNLTPSNTLALGTSLSFDLGVPIGHLLPVHTAVNRLLAVFADGKTAKVYRFDGNVAPVELEHFDAPVGESFVGVLPAPDGSFLLYSGTPGLGASANFHRFAPDAAGLQFSKTASGALPGVNAFGTTANVFLFAGEPFVANPPVLVRTLNAADWSSSPNLAGADVLVQAERLGTSAAGLDNPAARNLGPKPAGVTHALPNQYAPPISVASFQPAAGDAVVDIAITPPPGPQAGAITVTLTALNPPATVAWRTSPSQAWSSSLNVAQIPLFQNSNLEFFGTAGGRKSRIRSAGFTFPDPPATQDSDGDGVPDFVELAKGLNPNGGADSDGDGYTDKDELLGGTNPLDVNLPPTNAPIAKLEENAAFHLIASPRPFDGATSAEVSPQNDQPVHLHTLTGSFLDTEATLNVAGALFNPAARFLDAPADTTRQLLSVATDSHLDIQSGGPDIAVGREILALVPVPELNPPAVNFTPGPGPLEGQADAWIAAAQAALNSLTKPTVKVRFGPYETLAALLLERKLESILIGRGYPFPPTNRLTLFSFRPGDVTRQELTEGQLGELEFFGPLGEPAWNLVSMHASISNQLQAGVSVNLRELANDIYRISSLSNNAAPGQYPLPVDALRGFFDTGTLHSNYLAASSLNAAQLTQASNRVNGILIGLTPRPTNSFDLEVIANSFQEGVTTLKVVGSATLKNLFVARGVPFKFPDSFQLLTGSRVRALAFTDFTDPAPGDDLQVLSAELIAIPAPTLADTDGDLLPDDWECLFLGGLGDDSMGDLDGDGKSNLQEYLDGTDAKDGSSGAPLAVNLAPPVITLEDLGNGQLKLVWEFPAGYAGFFQFLVQTTTELEGGFSNETLTPTYLGNGKYELNLVGDGSVKFFILQQLKPAGGTTSLLSRPRHRY